MTGYARAEGSEGALAWTWEAKSVNGRGLEIRCRLPAGHDALEIPTREAATKRFKRGSLNLALAVRRQGVTTPITVNEVRLAKLAEIAQGLHRRLPDLQPASIDGLLALRGVLESGETEDEPAVTATTLKSMLASLELALDGLAAARAAEGNRLNDDLHNRLSEIAGLTDRAASVAAVDVTARKERIRNQVRELLDAAPALSEERLLAEAALLASKGDVTEEIERLRSHVKAARDMLAGSEAVGRRLDFLCQEFNREANTLCSKAADLALTSIGLALKASIEQFREQVQNAE
ncbi:MAG TPA: YicC/YloC family endoribonuclease [Magnetospirillaceae bacterium]|jgi:uncharacterized protein (TIGR00255 family)